MSDVEVPNSGDGLDDFDDYRPRGLCASCKVHQATELFPLYRGPVRYDFRCHCCVKRARLERAREYVGRIPELVKEFQAALKECA